MIQFDNRVILVTGAGRGLGRAYTMALAARGATVIAVDSGCELDGQGQDPQVIADLVDIAKDMGAQITGHCVDICDQAAMAEVLEQTLTRYGTIHGLVCNAGVLIRQQDNFAGDAHRTMMETNHLAHAALIQQLWPRFRQQNYGRIMMTAGLTGFYGEPGLSGYAASNAANLGMMRSLALQTGDYDIKINNLIPACYTRMSTSWILPTQADELTADCVVPAMLWMMSVEAPQGQAMVAGGGHYALADVMENQGIHLPPEQRRPEVLAQGWADLQQAEIEVTYTSFRERFGRIIRSVVEGR